MNICVHLFVHVGELCSVCLRLCVSVSDSPIKKMCSVMKVPVQVESRVRS